MRVIDQLRAAAGHPVHSPTWSRSTVGDEAAGCWTVCGWAECAVIRKAPRTRCAAAMRERFIVFFALSSTAGLPKATVAEWGSCE